LKIEESGVASLTVFRLAGLISKVSPLHSVSNFHFLQFEQFNHCLLFISRAKYGVSFSRVLFGAAYSRGENQSSLQRRVIASNPEIPRLGMGSLKASDGLAAVRGALSIDGSTAPFLTSPVSKQLLGRKSIYTVSVDCSVKK
jgi:hypothetical protein